MKFILGHGIDRIAAVLAAFALYYLTPPSHGWQTWAGSLVIVAFVLYAVRPE